MSLIELGLPDADDGEWFVAEGACPFRERVYDAIGTGREGWMVPFGNTRAPISR